MSAKTWKRPFDDSIPLPRGRLLDSLEDARPDITKLPEAEQEAAEWQGGAGLKPKVKL